MNRRPTVSVRSSSVGARANDYGGALWVDPVVHASGCRRFDSYVVRARRNQRPDPRVPEEVVTLSAAAAGQRHDVAGCHRERRVDEARAQLTAAAESRDFWGDDLSPACPVSAENWPVARQSTQVMDSLM